MTTTADPRLGRVPRSPRPTDDQLAAQARAAIRSAHADPRYDLALEPWIPVLQAGVVRRVGLRELLTHAHHLSEIAVPHALLRAALRRFLEALTADIVRVDRRRDEDDWHEMHADNSGFTTAQVDELLDRHGSHFHLWHPEAPFLQDLRLASVLVKPHADQPVQDLLLHLPSRWSAAWWVKAGEPALRGGLSPGDTAMWLLARWFYGINGNCGDLRLPDGSTVGSQSGGAFAETVATITHAFRVDDVSLFRSMLRGLPVTLARDGEPRTSCAWLDLQQPRPLPDPLYQATLNPAAVLLTARDGEGRVLRFGRGSTPLHADQAKVLRDLAMHADQHRVTAIDAKGAVNAVRVPPGALHGDLLRAFHRAAYDDQRLGGVVNSADCWLTPSAATVDGERLDVLLVAKGGTGSSPVWEDLAGVDLPARYVDPAHPDIEYVEHVRAAVRIAFDPKDGVRQRLEWALGDLLAQPADGGWKRPLRDTSVGRTVTSLLTVAHDDWQVRTQQAFESVLDNKEAGVETWRAAVWLAAREAFDAVTRPYTISSRYAPRYAAALRWLTPRSIR